MTDNKIWHDNIDSSFSEIAGIIDNPKNIIKYKGKYIYLEDLISLADRVEKLEQENISLKLSLEPCPGCGMHNCDCICQEIRMANDRQYEQEPTREMLMDGGIIDSHGNPY